MEELKSKYLKIRNKGKIATVSNYKLKNRFKMDHLEKYKMTLSKGNINQNGEMKNIWFAILYQQRKDDSLMEKFSLVDSVQSENYSELMTGVADKGWIDKINKNA